MIFKKREIIVIFTKEFKYVINKNYKKQKQDYVLNVNKLKKTLYGEYPIVLNKPQSFIFNFEIKKMFNKALNIPNKKYNTIIYINSEMTANTIKNIIEYLNDMHSEDNEFVYYVVDKFDEFDELIKEVNIKKIKQYVGW